LSSLIQEAQSLANGLFPITRDKVLDSNVEHLLRLARRLMAALPSELAGADNPDYEVAENWRKPARQVAANLLESAPWLSETTQQSLKEFLAEFPAEICMGKYEFTADWFSRKCEDQWLHDLAEIVGRPKLSFIEVGCFEGRTTVWLLDNVLTHPSSRIICIDPLFSSYRDRFYRNLAASGARSKVMVKETYSWDAICHLGRRIFDFAYIDGDHRREIVLEDAVLLWRRLKVGGLMTFDDYHSTDVRSAVDAFMSVYEHSCVRVHEGSQFTILRTSEVSPRTSTFYGTP
jgi:predicted O-methyltransferase YrrM